MKNTRFDHIIKIMSKHYSILTENFTIFFQMQAKLETCRNSEADLCEIIKM